MAEPVKPNVTISVSVQHTLREDEIATIHIGDCIVCRGQGLEVFTGKSGEDICVNANACFGRYCKLPNEVVREDLKELTDDA